MSGKRDATYLASRLKRDHRDIAAAVERGEYRSIRAAAIAAGIVKVKEWHAKQALAIANHSAELLEVAKLLVQVGRNEILEVGHRLHVGADGHRDGIPIAPVQGVQAIKQHPPGVARGHSFAAR